jgi:hypothetical protein
MWPCAHPYSAQLTSSAPVCTFVRSLIIVLCNCQVSPEFTRAPGSSSRLKGQQQANEFQSQLLSPRTEIRAWGQLPPTDSSSFVDEARQLPTIPERKLCMPASKFAADTSQAGEKVGQINVNTSSPDLPEGGIFLRTKMQNGSRWGDYNARAVERFAPRPTSVDYQPPLLPPVGGLN